MSEDSKREYEAAVNAAVLTGEFSCAHCDDPGLHTPAEGYRVRFTCHGCGRTLDEQDVRASVARTFAGAHAAETLPALPPGNDDSIPPPAAIPRGHAVATWRAALADVHHALDHLAATGDALARALDA
jgi:hypothetical protein